MNNPPAFPKVVQDAVRPEVYWDQYGAQQTTHIAHLRSEGGMTLLDYFAGQALPALMTKNSTDVARLCSDAYMIATHMLMQREARE